MATSTGSTGVSFAEGAAADMQLRSRCLQQCTLHGAPHPTHQIAAVPGGSQCVRPLKITH